MDEKEINVVVDPKLEEELTEDWLKERQEKKLKKQISSTYINNPLSTVKKYCKRKEVDTEMLVDIKKFIDEFLEKNKEKRRQQLDEKIKQLIAERDSI